MGCAESSQAPAGSPKAGAPRRDQHIVPQATDSGGKTSTSSWSSAGAATNSVSTWRTRSSESASCGACPPSIDDLHAAHVAASSQSVLAQKQQNPLVAREKRSLQDDRHEIEQENGIVAQTPACQGEEELEGEGHDLEYEDATSPKAPSYPWRSSSPTANSIVHADDTATYAAMPGDLIPLVPAASIMQNEDLQKNRWSGKIKEEHGNNSPHTNASRVTQVCANLGGPSLPIASLPMFDFSPSNSSFISTRGSHREFGEHSIGSSASEMLYSDISEPSIPQSHQPLNQSRSGSKARSRSHRQSSTVTVPSQVSAYRRMLVRGMMEDEEHDMPTPEIHGEVRPETSDMDECLELLEAEG